MHVFYEVVIMRKMSRSYHKKMTKLLAVSAAFCLVSSGGAGKLTLRPVYAQDGSEDVPSSMTMDFEGPLCNLGVPYSSDGVFYWADDSYVPSSGESCELIFEPYGSEYDTVSYYVVIYVTGEGSYDDAYDDAYYNEYEDSYEDDEYEDSYEDNEYEDSYEDDEYEDSYEDDEYEDSYDAGYEDSYEEYEDSYGADSCDEDENTESGLDSPCETSDDTDIDMESDYPDSDDQDADETDSAAVSYEAVGDSSADLDAGEDVDPDDDEEHEGNPAEETDAESTADSTGEVDTESTADSTGEVDADSASDSTGEVDTYSTTDASAETSEDNWTVFDDDTLQPRPAEGLIIGSDETSESDSASEIAGTIGFGVITEEPILNTDEILAMGSDTRNSNGITITGGFLPWYVQFRVYSGDSLEYDNEGSANIFQSYEFELWDALNGVEYHIPDGETIVVTLPVKDGYTYSVEHILDNGGVETIIPYVENGMMTFQTSSFSSFGIAGSTTLVGDEILEGEFGPDDSLETESVTSDAGTAGSGNGTTSSQVVAGGTTSSQVVAGGTTSSQVVAGGTTSSQVVAGGTTSSQVVAGGTTSSQVAAGGLTGTQTETHESNPAVQGTGTATENQSDTAVGRFGVQTGDSSDILPYMMLFGGAAILMLGSSTLIIRRKERQ